MNPYIETSTANCTRHNAVQGFAVISDNKCEPREYMETNMGPWGWQWRDGVGDLVSASPSPIRVTIKTLMDDIEKNAPGMYRTITDLAYSRSPECPFIVDEQSMADLRNRLHRYENEKTLLPPDAQMGVRKSIAAALGERKGSRSDGKIYAVMYPCSVDVERIVDSLCGPHRAFETFSVGEDGSGSGTMSMDLGTEYDTPSTPPTPGVIGSKICVEITSLGRVDGSPGREP